MTTTVQLTGISKRYRGTTALNGVDLSFRPGITGLLGPNGAGKTTLLRIIATVLAPDEGGVHLLGRSPDTSETLAEVRRQLGYLPQEMGFPRGFTAFGFVDYMAVLKEWTERSSRHDEVRRVLGLVDLADVATKRVRALSGGQRRRVALAQALLGDPALLLLDEPTTGVDPQQRVSLRQVLSQAGERSTVLLSTHQTEDVAALVRPCRGSRPGKDPVRRRGHRPRGDGRRPGMAGRRAGPGGAGLLAHGHGAASQRGRSRATRCRADRAHPGGRIPAAGRRPRPHRGGGGMTAVTARAVTPAPGATLRALAAVEARRYARHPLFLAGVALLIWQMIVISQDAARAGDDVSATLVDIAIYPAFTLGLLGVFVGVHLTRSMASSSDPIDASPTDGVRRVAAMCLACLVPGAVALVWFAWAYAITAMWAVPATAMPSGSVAAIRVSGIVCAVGGPLFGVMVGRWTRFPGAGLLAAFVLFGWVMLSTGALAMSASRIGNLAHVWAPFVGWLSADGPTQAPWIAGGSPLWHLIYITALCGLAATAAMLHDAWGTQRARLIRVFVLVSVLALVSLALAAAADPTRIPL